MRSTKSPSSLERLLGLGPLPVPPHVFGCSPEGLAYGAFSRGAAGVALEEYRTETLDDGTFQHGLLGGPPREPKAFAERVRSFVAGLDRPVREATLVVPDAWLRTVFAEVGEVPSNGAAREDVLRWKLKRLVPFRVDELRVRAVEVTPVVGQQEPRRLLLGFGVETLMAHLERAFRAAGVHLGRITNRGLGALGAVEDPGAPEGTGELAGLVLAGEAGYTVVFRRGEEPILHRFKTFPRTMPEDARAASVRRDMRLTRTYLEEHWPDAELGSVVLAAPDDVSAAHWTEWLQAGLDRLATTPGDGAALRVRPPEGPGRPSWPELLPLAGAVCQEVSP